MNKDRKGNYFSSYDNARLSDAITTVGEKIDENGKSMTEAFARVADALEKLTTEVKGLRSDLNPDLGKSKLNTPQAKG